MELTVNLAGTDIGLSFLDDAKKAMPLCNQYFQGFLCPDRRADAEVEVSILKKADGRFPFQENVKVKIFQQLLPTQDVVAWLRKSPEYTEDFPINEKTISSFCQGGLLLFNPNTARGRIYLLEQGARRFQALYRLVWLYFAQVLGERGGCFVHSAAVVKDGEGYLFMGDSGSGKSTLVKLCPECSVLSDDSPILFEESGEYRIYPSPYHQMDPVGGLDKEVIHMSARVKGIYFLIKDDRVFLEVISRKAALSLILKRYIHFFAYLSAQAKIALFDLFLDGCYKLNLWYLHFAPDADTWKVIARR